METGTIIDLIEEAIHTEGDLLSDEQVLDIIEELLKKRATDVHCEECNNGTDSPCKDCLAEEEGK